MKRKNSSFLVLLLAATLFIPTFLLGEKALAAGSIYVNDSQSVMGTDIGSAYAVGGNGTVSVVGDSYAITGDGVVKIGQSSTTTPTIPSGDPDGTTVKISRLTARIGLYYYYNTSRNTTLSSANLENRVGSGYKFGYYDSSRVFHELGSTAETKLTMVPNVNTAVSGGTVGCYHIKLAGSYSDFASAQSVAAQYTDGFPAWINGTYYAMIGNYQSATEAANAIASLGVGGEAFTGSNRCVAVTKTGSTKVLFEFDYGTTANLAVHPVSNSGAAQTWFKGYSYYGDFEYYRYISDKLTVINVVDVEDYVKGVVSVEMSASWPIEALKAQSLSARSYFATNVGRYSLFGFDITADTYCQAYKGTNASNSNSDAAVEATRDEYITYNGSICSTLYFASDGGGTEDSENIFTTALPYMRGVADPFEADVPATQNIYKSWHYEFSGDELRTKLAVYGYSGGTIVSAVPEYSDTGNVIKMTYSDASGNSKTITKSSNYSVLGLPSVHYTITTSPNAAGKFVIDGSGWGHNVGMSQWGAYSMALNYGCNYRQILRYYFTGINISQGVVA